MQEYSPAFVQQAWGRVRWLVPPSAKRVPFIDECSRCGECIDKDQRKTLLREEEPIHYYCYPGIR